MEQNTITKHNAIWNTANQKVFLMVWPTDPKSFESEIEIKVNSIVDISPGDFLETGMKTGYEVIAVVHEKPSGMKKMTYYTLKAKRVKYKNNL